MKTESKSELKIRIFYKTEHKINYKSELQITINIKNQNLQIVPSRILKFLQIRISKLNQNINLNKFT